jgi:hypothetical protein
MSRLDLPKTRAASSSRTSTGLPSFHGGQPGHLKFSVSYTDEKMRESEARLVLPYKRHISAISDLRPEEKTAFADALSQITIRYDNLFSCLFAYSMGIHQRPVLSGDDVAHLHLHFTPPLLRSATVRKFLVGCGFPPSRSFRTNCFPADSSSWPRHNVI